MHLIDGKKLAAEKEAELQHKITAAKIKPGLAIILAGNNPASHLYVRLKEHAAKKIGVHVTVKRFSKKVTTDEITKTIRTLNTDPRVHGIIVQLPLPAGVVTNDVITAIDPDKDVDGFHPTNIIRYQSGDNSAMPLLISVIDQLIQVSGSVQGKTAAIIAKESVFSEGLEHFFLTRKATAVRTELDQGWLKEADIVIIALGQPHALTGAMIKKGAVVIDIGITKKEGKTLGDVDPSVKKVAGWLTPVPGGVGPLTVATLLERTTINAFTHA